MLLMVMEMRMSDWTDFVGVISVCFNVQVQSVLFCLILYEVNFKGDSNPNDKYVLSERAL